MRWRAWPGHEPVRRLVAVGALAVGATMVAVAFLGFHDGAPDRLRRASSPGLGYDDASAWRLWVMVLAVAGAGLLVVLKLWVRRDPGSGPLPQGRSGLAGKYPPQGTSGPLPQGRSGLWWRVRAPEGGPRGPGGSARSTTGAALLGVPAVFCGFLLRLFLSGSQELSVAEESYRSLAAYGVVVLVVGVLLVAPTPWPAGGSWALGRRCLAVVAVVAVSVPATAVLAGALTGGEEPPPRAPQAVPRSGWPAVETSADGSWTVAPEGYVTDMVGTGSGLLVLEEGTERYSGVGRYRNEEAERGAAQEASEAGAGEQGVEASPTAAAQGEAEAAEGTGSPEATVGPQGTGEAGSAGMTGSPEPSEASEGPAEEAYLSLFDAQGAVVWRYSLPGTPVTDLSSPLVLDPQGRRVLVAYQYVRDPDHRLSSDVTVVAVLDVASGDLAWCHEVEESLCAMALTQGQVALQTVPRDRLRGSTLSVYSPEGGLVWSRAESRRLLTAGSTGLALVPLSNEGLYGSYSRLDLVDVTTGEETGGYDDVEVPSTSAGSIVPRPPSGGITPRLPAGWVARCTAGCRDQGGQAASQARTTRRGRSTAGLSWSSWTRAAPLTSAPTATTPWSPRRARTSTSASLRALP